MSRVQTFGFEINTTDDGVEFTNVYSNASISPITVRSGKYSGKISSLESGVLQGFKSVLPSSLVADTMYFRSYVNFGTFPSAENRFISVNADLAYATIDNTGVLKLYDEDGQISGTTILSSDIWYRIELHVNKVGAGSDTVELMVDGVVIATSSTRSLSSTCTYYIVGGNLNNEAQVNGVWYFDDLAINEGTYVDGVDGGYPGEGIVEYLFPTSFSDYTFLGNANRFVVGPDRAPINDSTFMLLNNNPPDDNTYIAATLSGSAEFFKLDNMELDTLSILTYGQVSVRWRSNIEIPPTYYPAVGVAMGPISYTGPPFFNINNDDWTTNGDSYNGYTNFAHTRMSLGVTSAPVTNIALKDTLFIGVSVSNPDEEESYIEVSSLWAVVEYIKPFENVTFTPDEFVMLVKTTVPADSLAMQFTIPTTGTGYDYDVDWGDGNTSTSVTGDATHFYTYSGYYVIKITGDFPRIFFDGETFYKDALKVVAIYNWGDIAWTSMHGAFNGCRNLSIIAQDQPDLSNVTDMSYMFTDARSLNQSIDSWNTSNVTDMSHMFEQAFGFNQPLNSWDTSNVTDMSSMFTFTFTFNQPLDNWDVSNVTDMSSMFLYALLFNQPLNSWDTSSLLNMDLTFTYAKSFDQPLDNWDVSNITNMSYLFSNCLVFDQPLDNWDVSNVTDMSSMFGGVTAEGDPAAGLSRANYDATLTGWSALTLQPSVTFDAGRSVYCTSEAARTSIITDNSWTINDSGKNCYYNSSSILIYN